MKTDREQVRVVAQRRLALLADDVGTTSPAPDEPAPVQVLAPGRHARVLPRVGGWLQDRLPPALQGRVSLNHRHLRWLAGLLAASLALALWVGWRSAADPVPVVRVSPATPSPAPQASPSASAQPIQVVVHVAGKVRHPGLVSLPAGARVFDALKKAGGPRPGVRVDTLNLARPLVDGEQILVGVRSGVAGGSSSASSAWPSGGVVSLNSGTMADLDALPGVGPVTAQKIIDWRSRHGAFTSVDELLEVDGIGPATLADIKPHVTL